MGKLINTIRTTEDIQRAVSWVFENASKGLAGGPVVVTLGRETRSTDQNSKLWPMLADISKQIEWSEQKLSPEEWKDLITAAVRGQKMLPGIEGGLVMVGQSTSRMNKAQFSELIEYLYAFGAERGIQWSEPAIKAYEQYKEAQ